jgi:hypothetical protein
MYKKNEMNNRNKGQGLVELALVMPFLLVIVFGVFDLGRIYFSTIILTGAAREGTRYLSVFPDDVDHSLGRFYGTKQASYLEARNSGIELDCDSQIDVVCDTVDDPDLCDSGKPAVVTVTTDFDLILGWLLPSPITVTRTAHMVVP